MAKLIDFDKKYMSFASKYVKDMANLSEDELEKALNDTVSKWLKEGDAELGGRTPDEYFAKMSPQELADNLAAYGEGGMNVPEPLYRRISGTAECAGPLAEIARNRALGEKTRGTALRLLIDMNAEGLETLAADMLLEGGELSDEAADWLKGAGYGVVGPLLSRYDAADEEVREAILDVLCAYPGVERTVKILSERLLSDHERRALHASYAARLGDESLLGPLKALCGMSDLTYFDYMEIRNAIEALGGEPGAERQFYGDPDFERLRAEPE
jgi:hypothetical protein